MERTDTSLQAAWAVIDDLLERVEKLEQAKAPPKPEPAPSKLPPLGTGKDG